MNKRILASAAILCAMALMGHAQTVTPILQPHVNFPNGVGGPCTGCSLYSYAAGTTTPQATYTDSTGLVQNTNPIVLDAAGGANVWVGSNAYKFVLKDTGGNTIWTVDNVRSVTGFLSGYLPLTGGNISGSLSVGGNTSVIGSQTVGGNSSVAGTLTAPNLSTETQAQNIANTILSRAYQAYVTVTPGTGTITAAVAGISDAGPSKRYEVYLPNGTYSSEAIVTKDYVDIIGQSQSGVIIQSSSEAASNDTVYFSGTDTLLANVTVNHTLTSLAAFHNYPIHMDHSSTTESRTEILYRVTANTFGNYTPPGGTVVYGAIGMGISGVQTMVLIDVTANSGTMNGILAHNQVSQTTGPAKLYMINCAASSQALNGFEWQSIGSTQPDIVQIVGGSYTGANGQSSIYAHNNSGSAGAGEAYLQIDPSVSVPQGISNTQHAVNGPPLIALPQYQDLMVANSLFTTTVGGVGANSACYIDFGVSAANQATVNNCDLVVGISHKLETNTLQIGVSGNLVTADQGNGSKLQHSTGSLGSGNFLKADANGNSVDSSVAATSVTQSLTTPVVNSLACIKTVGPPVIIGYCSAYTSGTTCTCN